MSLTAIPEPRALDAGLAARSCHKNVIIKKKKSKKKNQQEEKTNEEKKKSELTRLTLQARLTR